MKNDNLKNLTVAEFMNLDRKSFDSAKARQSVGLAQNYIKELDPIFTMPLPADVKEPELLTPAEQKDDDLYVILRAEDSSTSAIPRVEKSTQKKNQKKNRQMKTYKGDSDEKTNFSN